MASIFPNRFCTNSLTHPRHFYFGFQAKQTKETKDRHFFFVALVRFRGIRTPQRPEQA